ncbi:deleted in malignant brain tumors 1 protein-like [Gambusia affinis]|uniref:deleted in malignant brain tumors 1 protein-like n=1 Tax=Gambusia affinis TaxID=33528 RepID=UPI001CDB93E0|nr:deleted in malignant brain tumors 1 protein-like [Gambusia affinis]
MVNNLLLLVSCFLSSYSASDNLIRLSGSNEPCSGRVEIYYNGVWGTVCDDLWDLNDAAVACRQLGCGPALYALQTAQFGQGTGPIWLDDLVCSGSETSLAVCGHRGFGIHNCGHVEDAGVICSNPSIRLSGSNEPCSGRVEIYYSGVWGTVCDDLWDLNDAAVACRQLGCGPALGAPYSAQFGQGTGEIWLDDLVCSGNETSLALCGHNGFGTHNCGHGEDAGVICSNHSIRLSGSNESCSGRVEIYYNGVWGTVCDDLWDLNDAAVACRQLGCGPALSAPISAQFGQGTGPIWLDDLVCSGSETSLAVCGHSGFGTHNCGHYKDAGVICSQIPPKPSITMDPAGIVTFGDLIAITCSVSTQYLGGSFTLQKTTGSFTKTQQSSTNSSTFRFLEANNNHEGNYYCYHQKTVDHQTLTSPNSDSVTVSVSDN